MKGLQDFRPAKITPDWEYTWLTVFEDYDSDSVIECARTLSRIIAEERCHQPDFEFSVDQPDLFHYALDFLKGNYKGDSSKTVEEAEIDLHYLFDDESSPERIIIDGVIAAAKRLRTAQMRENNEEPAEEDNNTIIEKIIPEPSVTEKWSVYIDKAKSRLDTAHNICKSEKIYVLTSDVTYMPLICSQQKKENTYLFVCTDKEVAHNLAEHRKTSHGDKCFVAEYTPAEILEALSVYGVKHICYVPKIAETIFLQESDFFSSFFNCFFDFVDFTGKYPESYGDKKFLSDVLIDFQHNENLSKDTLRRLKRTSVFVPVTEIPGTELFSGHNVYSETNVTDSGIRQVPVFYLDSFDIRKKHGDKVKIKRVYLEKLIAKMRSTNLLLRVGYCNIPISIFDFFDLDKV